MLGLNNSKKISKINFRYIHDSSTLVRLTASVQDIFCLNAKIRHTRSNSFKIKTYLIKIYINVEER
jgi:hypothetical protein